MLWESCSSSYTEHNKIRFAIFGFSTILYRIYKFQPRHTRRVESICTLALGTFKLSQLHPFLEQSAPQVTKSLTHRAPTAIWARRRQTNGTWLRLALPSLDW
jgi:hypothetical protein